LRGDKANDVLLEMNYIRPVNDIEAMEIKEGKYLQMKKHYDPIGLIGNHLSKIGFVDGCFLFLSC